MSTAEEFGLVAEDRPHESWHRHLRTPKGVAVGLNEDGSVDEILAKNIKGLFIDKQNAAYWRLQVEDLIVGFRSVFAPVTADDYVDEDTFETSDEEIPKLICEIESLTSSYLPEILHPACESYHLEQMSEAHFWMAPDIENRIEFYAEGNNDLGYPQVTIKAFIELEDQTLIASSQDTEVALN